MLSREIDITKNRKLHFGVFLIVLSFLSLFMIYLYGPLYMGHDTPVHYARLQGLIDAMREGRLPFYINYNGLDGYGYFIKAFYSDVVLIPFALIGLISNTDFAYESILIVSTLLCGVLGYWAVNRISGNALAAGITAILYTFCSYRLFDLYNRGAIGEAISFTILPIVLVGVYEIIKGDCKKNWYILTIGYSLLIFNHVLSTAMTSLVVILFLIIYCKPLIKEPKRIVYLIVSGIATVLITGCYLFPMIEQMASNSFYYTTQPFMDVMDGAGIRFMKLVKGVINIKIVNDGALPIKIGLLPVLAICARIFVSRKAQFVKHADIISGVGVLLILASSAYFPWGVFPFNKLGFVQFPWRFLEFASFLLCISGGYYLSQILKNGKLKVGVLSLIVILTAITIYYDNQYFKQMNTTLMSEAGAESKLSYGGCEYIPSQVPSVEFIHTNGYKINTSDSTALISDLKRTEGVTWCNIGICKPTELEFPLLYYKGYEGELNGKIIPIQQSKNGLIEATANESGQIKIYYAGTGIQNISTIISVLSVIGLCVYVIMRRKI